MNAFSHNYTLELCNGEKSDCEVVNVSLAGNGPFICIRAMNGREKKVNEQTEKWKRTKLHAHVHSGIKCCTKLQSLGKYLEYNCTLPQKWKKEGPLTGTRNFGKTILLTTDRLNSAK